MKKIIIFLCVVGMALIFVGATLPIHMRSDQKKSVKRGGCGYRIIEFGVGVNCNGDTVKLVRSKGFQRLASDEEVSTGGL